MSDSENEGVESESGNKRQVNVRVDQNRYDHWQEHVGADPSDDFRHISDLVRYAVEAELAGSEKEDVSTQVEADLSVINEEVLPLLASLQDGISNLDDRLRALEREEAATTSEPDLERLVWELLPCRDEMEGVDGARSVGELANLTGAASHDIRAAITSLRERRQDAVVSEQLPVRPEEPNDLDKPVVYYRS